MIDFMLKKCDAIALRTAKLTGKIINNCEKLKIVSRAPHLAPGGVRRSF